MEELRPSTLFGGYAIVGAIMTSFMGWSMSLRYTSDREEYWAVREPVGKLDLSHIRQAKIKRPWTAVALDYPLYAKPSIIPAGRACYSMMSVPDGGIIDDLIVYRLGEVKYLVVPNGANRIAVVEELTRRGCEWCAKNEVSKNHSIVDRTLKRVFVAVQGPELLEAIVALLSPEDTEYVTALGYYHAFEAKIGGVPAMITRMEYTGKTGYGIMLLVSATPGMWRKIEAKACGLAFRDTPHLETGMPLYGNEPGRDVIPADVGVAWLPMDHEFVGGTALVERKPTWDLYALVGEGCCTVRTGNMAMGEGCGVGKMTSGTLSLTLGYPTTLARPEPGVVEGVVLDVDVWGTPQSMRATSPPFYKRPR